MIVPERARTSNSYAPRRISAFGQSYSIFVKILKLTLPLAALVIIGILITRFTEDQQPKGSLSTQGVKTKAGQIELIQAKYEGVDDQQRPYTITADKAVRAVNVPDTILFENPLADITLQDKTWLAVQSKTGSFDRTVEHLHLQDNVIVFHDSGYEMHLQDINVDLKQKTAVTALPVQGQGPMGTITAQNMTVSDQGNLIVFGGPATLTLFKL